MFQCDVKPLLASVQGEYSHFLNSEDLFTPELPMEKSKAKGGTMLLWDRSLDPYVKILPSPTPAVLPMVLKLPNFTISCHIVIYLPTSGQETEFVSAMANLDSCLSEIYLKYEGCPVFIRGDANVNPRNISRVRLFHHFLDKHRLFSIDMNHPTYHHFLGDGAWDSALDVLLHQVHNGASEQVQNIICKLTNPLLSSHHDMIISSLTLPPRKYEETSENVIVAPKVENLRTKIIWDQ